MQQTATSSDSGAARRTVRDTLRRAAGRLRRGRADERGLTTLEWLLIVAAVAGLAALAVVLVQNVVDETAEEISNQSARGTAARVAGERITREARAALPANADSAVAMGDAASAHRQAQQNAQERYSAACDRIEITYGDIEVRSNWTPVVVAPGALDAAISADSGGTHSDGSTRTQDSTGDLWTADPAPTEASCMITGI